MKVFTVIAEYIWNHCCAICATTLVLCIGLCNPLVVDKFQPIYRYPVSVAGSIVWDVIWVLGIIACIIMERIFKKIEET